MATSDQPEYTKAGVQGKIIYIVDFSKTTRPYNVKKYIKKFLKMVPREDLEEFGAIVLCDDNDRALDQPLGTLAGNYSKPTDSELAKIYIYLNWALGIFPFLPKPTWCEMWNVVRNRFFIALFGKAHLAQTLFHEIGHHHFMTILKARYADSEQAEKDAKEYGDSLYEKAFPRVMHLYQFFHYLFFQVIYKRDADDISNLRDQYLREKDGTGVNK